MSETRKITKSCISILFQITEVNPKGRAKKLKIIHLGNWTWTGKMAERTSCVCEGLID